MNFYHLCTRSVTFCCVAADLRGIKATGINVVADQCVSMLELLRSLCLVYVLNNKCVGYKLEMYSEYKGSSWKMDKSPKLHIKKRVFNWDRSNLVINQRARH